MCLSLVAELRRRNSNFPEVSHGVLVQQVIPDTPAQKYVHKHMKKSLRPSIWSQSKLLIDDGEDFTIDFVLSAVFQWRD